MYVKRVKLSKEELTVKEIKDFFIISEKGLKLFYDNLSVAKFLGDTSTEFDAKLARYIEELDKTTSLSLLSAIEAHFRVDYLNKCYGKKKDSLSIALREIYKTVYQEIPLPELINEWRKLFTRSRFIPEFHLALKYRHWLAHGRYWVYPSRKFDFASILALAVGLQNELGIKMGA
jgi:hypothetical protein